MITPTYYRLTQKLELTRMSQTLQLAAHTVPIHWILVENADKKSPMVSSLLHRRSVENRNQ